MPYELTDNRFEWTQDLRRDLFRCLVLRFGGWSPEAWTANHKPAEQGGALAYEQSLRAFCVVHGMVEDKWTAVDQQVRFALSMSDHEPSNQALYALLNRAAAVEVGFFTNQSCPRYVRQPDGTIALQRA
jgi:hypothetical protein